MVIKQNARVGKVLKQRLKAATKKGRLKPEANIETLVASQ